MKRSLFLFDSDTNQLPYSGVPGQYYSWTGALSVGQEEMFDDDGVPVKVNLFSLAWPAIDNSYSPVYARFRVRSETLNTMSAWSVPVLVHTPVRYAIYKRRVVANAVKWSLVEVTANTSVGPYSENWSGRVQYAVCIHHANAVPTATEGDSSATDFTNPYVLFATDPTSSTMNTKPGITIP